MVIRKANWIFCLLVLFHLSLGLLGYAWWLLTIDSGNRAYQRGDASTASRLYARAEKPFEHVPWLARIVKDDYQRLFFNRVNILYASGKQDEVLLKLEDAAMRMSFLTERAEYSFWLGNSLLHRALRGKIPESVIGDLKAAIAEYQRGLMAHPDDWDLKYDFELVKQVLSRKGSGKLTDEEEEEEIKSFLDKIQLQQNKLNEALPPDKQG